MLTRAKGLIHDRHDPRDLCFANLAEREGFAMTLPQSASLRPHCSPVRDQGSLGACTGFALTAARECWRILRGRPLTILSPEDLYYRERKREWTIPVDAGASLRDGLKVLLNRGVVPESDWPYDPVTFATVPATAKDADAAPWKIHAYHRLAGLNDVCQALAASQPVVAGIQVFESFESPEVDRTGVVPLPHPGAERLLGGHAILLVGYDVAAGTVTFKNSWGAGWGDQGYGTLPFTYFDVGIGLVLDLWTFRP